MVDLNWLFPTDCFQLIVQLMLVKLHWLTDGFWWIVLEWWIFMVSNEGFWLMDLRVMVSHRCFNTDGFGLMFLYWSFWLMILNWRIWNGGFQLMVSNWLFSTDVGKLILVDWWFLMDCVGLMDLDRCISTDGFSTGGFNWGFERMFPYWWFSTDQFRLMISDWWFSTDNFRLIIFDWWFSNDGFVSLILTGGFLSTHRFGPMDFDWSFWMMVFN